MDKDQLFISKLEELLVRSRDGYFPVATGFLDSHEQAIAERLLRSSGGGLTSAFYGGYESAERRLLVVYPSDFPSEAIDLSSYVSVIRVSVIKAHGRNASRSLTHRDYLGSVLGLGIERRLIGDILAGPSGADLLILPEIADFLLREYSSVGHTEVLVQEVSIEQLCVPASRTQLISDTVPSLRLDNIVASAFGLSRSNAVTAINAGIVSVNHIEVCKPDAHVEEGSVIVVKGKGKAVLSEIGGSSRKNRIWIRLLKYL